MARPIVFLKIGWMNRYKGARGDSVRAQHRFVQEHGEGAEDRNFLPRRGRCYGYAPMHRRLHLRERFPNLAGSDDYVDGVDIVFIARKPKGGVFVVGWYADARLYAVLQERYSRIWLTEASAENCRLLDPRDRNLVIPIGRDSGPRSPAVWYATRQDDLKRQVRKLMSGDYRPAPGHVMRATKPDVDVARKAEVERNAIRTVERFYTALGFDITDRQSDNIGWDLEAHRSSDIYRLEVKGSAHAQLMPELTPNEYSASRAYHMSYRICIVTRALTQRPTLNEVSFDSDTNEWVGDDGLRWRFAERTAARLTTFPSTSPEETATL